MRVFLVDFWDGGERGSCYVRANSIEEAYAVFGDNPFNAGLEIIRAVEART